MSLLDNYHLDWIIQIAKMCTS